MTNFILCCVSILVLVTAAAPALSGGQAVYGRHVLPNASSPAKSTEDDCETRMRKLDASPAEGQERLREKNEVIDYCASAFPPDFEILYICQLREGQLNSSGRIGSGWNSMPSSCSALASSGEASP
jgi:hypothetical protein